MHNVKKQRPLTGCQDEGVEPERLARFLEQEKGYSTEDIVKRLSITTSYNGEEVVSKIALVITLEGKQTVMLRYAPGSVVTRERSAVAAARLLVPDYQIPLVCVTNGEDAVLLDTYKGNTLAQSLAAFPTKEELEAMVLQYEPFTNPKKIEREKRILNAFDVDL